MEIATQLQFQTHAAYNADRVIVIILFPYFLNQARAWFLEITFVRTSVCVRACVCVCVRPRAIKNYSREMKSE